MFLELCLVIIACMCFWYIKYIRKYQYWKEMGVPSLDRNIQAKHNWDRLLKRRAMQDQKREEYNSFEGERFYGQFDGFHQILVVRDDFDLIRSIMVKDMDHFPRVQLGMLRDVPPANKTEEITLKMLMALYGDEWKAVRYVI